MRWRDRQKSEKGEKDGAETLKPFFLPRCGNFAGFTLVSHAERAKDQECPPNLRSIRYASCPSAKLVRVENSRVCFRATAVGRRRRYTPSSRGSSRGMTPNKRNGLKRLRHKEREKEEKKTRFDAKLWVAVWCTESVRSQ